MQASDLGAKLLAQENITVVRANAKTASFDVGSRVLTLPLWKDMTREIEDMMQCHEVGHALFTDADAWVKAIESYKGNMQRSMHGYMNVVEDARIEKLMKRRFPGVRKTFFAAYKQLVDRDFFKLKGRDVNEMLFIDRINLYFKAGITIGVKFTEAEKVLVNKVDRAETIEEAIEVAKEIYEFSKEEMQKRKAETAHEDIAFGGSDDEDEESGEDDFDMGLEDDEDELAHQFDEYEADEDAEKIEDELKNNKSAKGDVDVTDEDLESQTDKNLNKSLEELADDSISYQYYEFFTGLSHDPVVPFKKVIAETAEADQWIADEALNGYHNHKKDFEKFMLDSERMVNYLVKEFEMRKSAQAYRRAQISKSGSLNMNKIHAYKLTDDIFRRVMTVPEGKNHGMVFLLDWSGSMQDVILQTVRQVINLVMFCRRINIPFEVYAFSGQYNGTWTHEKTYTNNNYIREVSTNADKDLIFSDGRFSLLNLFSSKMTNNEFMTVARRFSSFQAQRCLGYNLGDTPLNEALLYMVDFIPEFTRRNNIEKMTMITLTDGQGGTLAYSGNYMKEFGYNEALAKRMKIKNFIRDPKTQKTYHIRPDSQSQTETLLKFIKDRYDVASLGFYICQNRRRVLSDVFRDNLGESAGENEIETMRSQFRENGFYSMMGTGRDELFVIPDTSTKIVDSELEVDSDLSAAAIARKFTKQFNTKKHSRVLLDRFIGYVA